MAIFFLATFLVPIAYFQLKQKRKIRAIQNVFHDVENKHQLNITRQEIWRESYGIGIDEKAGKVLYLNTNEGGTGPVIIDLEGVSKCRIFQEKRKVNSSGNIPQTVTDRLGLGFQFRNSDEPEVILEFYNGKEGAIINGEHALTEKWISIIRTCLKKSYVVA